MNAEQQFTVAQIVATLGHIPAPSLRCMAREANRTPAGKPPGPPSPPVWCYLRAGHAGPHKCNHGGMEVPYPLREPIEMVEPYDVCETCDTRWPCQESTRIGELFRGAA